MTPFLTFLFPYLEIDVHCHFEQSMQARFDMHQNSWVHHSPGSSLNDNWISEMRPKTAKFVMDEYPAQAVEDFGVELVKEDLFALPFPTCYFEWSWAGGAESILAIDEGDEDGVIGWWACQDKGGWGTGAPFRFGKSKLRQHLGLSNGAIKGYAANISDKIPGWVDGAETVEGIIVGIAACAALLAVKGIEKEVVTPRDSVNKKREKAGRPPLPTYTIVHLNRYRKKEGIGTHASPCPHLRRGHVRLLPSGKKTLVRPSIVMADPGIMPTYAVPKAPEEFTDAAK